MAVTKLERQRKTEEDWMFKPGTDLWCRSLRSRQRASKEWMQTTLCQALPWRHRCYLVIRDKSFTFWLFCPKVTKTNSKLTKSELKIDQNLNWWPWQTKWPWLIRFEARQIALFVKGSKQSTLAGILLFFFANLGFVWFANNSSGDVEDSWRRSSDYLVFIS